jgi:hypothetical protein
MKMSTKAKNTIGLILLFAFGMISGIAVTLIIEGGMMRKAFADPDVGRQILANRIVRELRLETEQRVELDDILIDTMGDLQAIREDVAPQVQEVLDNMRLRIDAILTPEQQAEFTRMYEGFHYAWERYGHMRKQQRFRGGRGEAGDGRNGPGGGLGGGGKAGNAKR